MKLKGNNIRISLNGTLLALCRECNLNVSREMKEKSSPDSSDAKEFIPGRYSWTSDSACLVGNFNQNTLLEYLLNKTKLSVSIGTVTGASEEFSFSGYAYINEFKFGAPLKGYATANVSFQGTGSLTSTHD